MTETQTLEWLLDSDPALKWQVQRDLVRSPPDEWHATRDRVATEGFGARMLAHQDEDGQWAGGAYFHADFDEASAEAEEGQPWTATTWSLNFLREWGLDPVVLAGTAEKLAANSRWEYEQLPYWGGEVDCCINAYTIENGVWLGAEIGGIVDWLVEHRLADGGWNCEWIDGSTRSSFHSTISSLRGLLAYDIATGGTAATRAARRGGEEYLLERALFKRLSTGEQVGPWATRLVHPFLWVYSVLNAADYFRKAALFDATAPDPRMTEAIELVRSRRRPDGVWLQERTQKGRVWFEMDVAEGEPSKWLTFYAMRVLEWWDAAALR
ncbi:squalene cyclase [Microbacterium sp. R86528]|uniref:squalene cyclase n=1 Tax=Microbacterium sp. R86528 TaxID=3093864 RepID=UPI0037C996C1